MARRKLPFYRVLLKDKYGTYFHYITQAQTAEQARQKALHHWICNRQSSELARSNGWSA